LALPLLGYLVPNSLPFEGQPGLDLRALGIAAGFTALIGIGFGLLPALRVGRRTGLSALREGSRGGGGRRQRLRTALVTAEVALSMAMLISSAFLIRAILRVQAVDPGFEAGRVLTMRTVLPTPRYDDRVRRAEFYRRVLAEARTLPGVENAAYTSGIPMVLTGGIAGVEVPGQELQDRRLSGVSWRFITPGFFSTLGVPVLSGRDFEEADRLDRPLVAMVSESFVERYWSGQNPLGKTFRIATRDSTISPWRTVVGIVRDIKVRGLERTSEPQLYLPAGQMPAVVGGLYDPKDLVIRTRAASTTLVPAIREIIRQADPEQPISEVRLLSDVVERQTASRRAQLQVLGALTLVALLLTGVGIHGLLAFLVAQRSREIGVHLALGASPGRVARMVVSEAGRWTLIGCVPGLLLAYGAARAMNALLFGLGPGDPVTFGIGLAVVVVVALAGSLLPAFHAVRINPLVAMRDE
jgi:predicted permease